MSYADPIKAKRLSFNIVSLVVATIYLTLTNRDKKWILKIPKFALRY